MSRAESLLNSLVRTGEVSSTSPINDTIVIDAEGRIINVPGTEILFGVEHDANIERKHFQCPRFVGDNVDLTTLGLRIVYRNANNEKDAYIVEDVKADGETITFSWLLGEKVLRTKGTVYFTICAVNVDAEGNETRHWNTTLASGTVLEGMEFDGLYPDEEEAARDVLQQLLNIFESKGQETIRSVADEGSRQKAYLEEKAFGAMVKQTTERDTLLTIQDAADFRIVDLGLDGKTEQYTTTGAQLFDKTLLLNNGGVEQSDGSIYMSSKIISFYTNEAEEAGQYTMTLTAKKEDNTNPLCLLVRYTDGTDEYFISANALSAEFKTVTHITNASKVVKKLSITFGTDGNYYIKDFMVNKGATALPYEPYTGGIPSPNTEFPQDINNAGRYNEETGRYEVDVEVCNKNYFNGGLLTSFFADVKGNMSSVAENHEKYRSILMNLSQGTYTVASSERCHFVRFLENDTLTTIGVGNTNSYTFTTIGGVVGVSFRKQDNTIWNDSITIHVEKGTTATEYIPHESQKVTLTSSRELTKWDKLVKREGVWGWVYKSIKYILNGSEKWGNYATYKGFFNSSVLKDNLNRAEGYCNQLIIDINGLKGRDKSGFLWLGVGGNTYIYVPNCVFYDESLEDKGHTNWVNHLKENPLEIWTYTNTEEFVPLLPEEQEALKALETYRGVTHIWNDQNTPIQITYVADPEIYIDRRLSEVSPGGMDETQFTESLADAGFITILTDENGNTLTDENGNTLIAKGPEANHNPDWNETDESSPSFILNKPTGIGGVGNVCYVISGPYLFKTSNPSEASESNRVTNINACLNEYMTTGIMLHHKGNFDINVGTYMPCLGFGISTGVYHIACLTPGTSYITNYRLSYDINTGNALK